MSGEWRKCNFLTARGRSRRCPRAVRYPSLLINADDVSRKYDIALGNCWVDCRCMPGKIINFYWPARSKKVLERMTAVDADWYNGSIRFSWAAYYAMLPGFFGGDMEKAGRYFNRALALGPHMTNFYVSRALFYQVKKNDRKGFSEDLHHVLAVDPRRADELEYPWAVWYQRKAIRALRDINTYFKQ